MSETDSPSVVATVARAWWAVFLLLGAAWLVFAVIVFRFDWRTVHAISILFGIVVIAAAFDEILAAFAEGKRRWARALHLLLAAAFVVIAVISFIHPGDTVEALAAVISIYFIVKGIVDFVVALTVRAERELWWVQFLLGIVEILIGFWAAGDFGLSLFLLVVWVGVVALTRGFYALTAAFTLHESADSPG